MSEFEPSMKLSFPDGEFEATRENAILYTFLGGLSMYNHVYLILDEETASVSYIFGHNPGFEVMKNYMLENQYIAHLNMPAVCDEDRRVFDMAIQSSVSDLDNGIPEDWK